MDLALIRQIFRLCVVMLFSALGASMAFSVPLATSEISFFQTENHHIVHTVDVGFAARAPPLAVANITVTGGVTVMQGSASALHGQETVAALFGFDGSSIAPNTEVRVPRSVGADIPSQPVNNIGEFFNTITGNVFMKASSRTGKTFQGQQIYKADKNIRLQDGSKIRKGDQFYLDGLHKNHLEVFDSKGKPRIIVDLAGKKLSDQKTNRRIP